MSWRTWIPGWGDKTVRQRVWELEQEAGSLPTLFAVLFGAYIVTEAEHTPIPFIPPRYKVLIAAIGVALLFIYRDKRKRAIKKLKEEKDKRTLPGEQKKLLHYSNQDEEEKGQ